MTDHLDDLRADFRRYYHVENWEKLSGPEFFKLAYRVSAYGGVMTLRYANQQTISSIDTVPSLPSVLSLHPGFRGLIEFGSS